MTDEQDLVNGFIEHNLTSEKIDHPDHYNMGQIEVIDVIEDWQLGFHLGSAVKYIARAGRKDAELEFQDLKKAIWYIERYMGMAE